MADVANAVERQRKVRADRCPAVTGGCIKYMFSDFIPHARLCEGKTKDQLHRVLNKANRSSVLCEISWGQEGCFL